MVTEKDLSTLKQLSGKKAAIRRGVEQLVAKKRDFIQQIADIDEAILANKADFTIQMGGLDEDDLDESVNLLEYDNGSLSLNDLERKRELLENRINKNINPSIDRQQGKIISLQNQENNDLKNIISTFPLEMQLMLTVLDRIGETEKVIAYIEKSLKVNLEEENTYQEFLQTLAIDIDADLKQRATIALISEGHLINISGADHDEFIEQVKTNLVRNDRKYAVTKSIKFQDLPPDIQEKLIKQRMVVLRLSSYLELSNVKEENPELYNELSGFYRELQKNIENSLLDFRNFSNYEADFALISTKMAERSAEMSKYIFNKRFFTITNAKVIAGAAAISTAATLALHKAELTKSVISWYLGDGIITNITNDTIDSIADNTVVSTALGATSTVGAVVGANMFGGGVVGAVTGGAAVAGAGAVVGGATMAGGLYKKADRETKEQVAKETAEHNQMVDDVKNEKRQAVDLIYLTELDKKFGVGTGKPLNDLQFEKQTVAGQASGGAVEVGYFILNKAKIFFSNLSRIKKINILISAVVAVVPVVAFIATNPVVAPAILLSILAVGVGVFVAFKIGLPIDKMANKVLGFAYSLGNYIMRPFRKPVDSLTLETPDIQMSKKIEPKPTHIKITDEEKVKRLNDLFPGIGDKLMHHFNVRIKELESRSKSGFFDFKGIRADIKKAHEDLNELISIAEINNPEQFCQQLNKYLTERYLVESEIFKATTLSHSEPKVYKERERHYMLHGTKENSAVNKDLNASTFDMGAQIKDRKTERASLDELSELKDMLDAMRSNLLKR